MNDFSRNQVVADTGIFIALFLGLGYIFLYVPNVEFITLIAWLAGFWLGIPAALIVAGLGEAVFAILNPLGSSLVYLPLFIMQISAFLIIATAGWLNGKIPAVYYGKNRIITGLLAGINGLVLTLIYDILTTLAFPLASGFSGEQILATLIAGIPFSALHLLSNTLIFAIIVPVLLEKAAQLFPRFNRQQVK